MRPDVLCGMVPISVHLTLYLEYYVSQVINMLHKCNYWWLHNILLYTNAIIYIIIIILFWGFCFPLSWTFLHKSLPTFLNFSWHRFPEVEFLAKAHECFNSLISFSKFLCKRMILALFSALRMMMFILLYFLKYCVNF